MEALSTAMNAIKSKVIEPSLHLGGGYTFLGKSSFGTINPGAGLTLWFSDHVGLAGLHTKKHSKWRPISSFSLSTYCIVFKFGGKDTDGDGIYDKDDALVQKLLV
jgi:hypothetical protein